MEPAASSDENDQSANNRTDDERASRASQFDNVVIELRNVVKRFTVGDNEVTILKSINLQIKQGEFVSIVGPSGSGKSTLLNMITGIDRPTSGEVYVAGTRIDMMSEGELARWRGVNLGIVFQFFQLIPALNLIDNVMLPMDFAGKYRPKERRERAMALLEMVGLGVHALKLPGTVSGGEQQRAAIARALANDPPLLVTDEPTGNLDTVTSQQVFELFRNLVYEGKTVVMVTHNRQLAGETPRDIELVDGQIVRDENSNLLRV
jgi:putative ABC transport system ATP-binding protein